jgi:hypothetical protein
MNHGCQEAVLMIPTCADRRKAKRDVPDAWTGTLSD